MSLLPSLLTTSTDCSMLLLLVTSLLDGTGVYRRDVSNYRVGRDINKYRVRNKLMARILSKVNRFSIFFHSKILRWICSKLVIKRPTTPCICYRTTLWNMTVKKQVINNKLQGSAAPILSVLPALIVHSKLKSVHPGFPVAFIFKHKLINK